ncbi:MAG: glycosyltransferase family 4 protein [Candidatus Limnocylindrales bacterium]
MTPEGVEALPLAVAGLVLASLVAFFLTPLAARFATAVGAIDRPGERRVHHAATPRGGGLAVAAAFLAVGLAVLWYERQEDVVSLSYRPQAAQVAALFAGAAVAAVLGFVDDRFDLRARWQFLGQLVLAAIALASGMRIGFINNPLGGETITFGVVTGIVLTVFWIVGMINSINFIDGLDGLSSGIAMIAALTLGGISFTVTQNQPVVAVLCFTLAGALAGFLPWNFHPAHIFIGTTGVFVIGYTLAVLSLLGTAKVAVALLVLGVPIIDTFWIIVRRLAEGSSPFAPDRGHFHHRLLDLGLGHRQAVLLIYAICAVLAILSFRLSGTGQMYAFLGIVVGGGLVLYLLTARARAAGSSGLDPNAYEEEVRPEAGGRQERKP